MSCKCKEAERLIKQQAERRQAWNAQAIALLSDVTALVKKTNPELAESIGTLIANLNSLSIEDAHLAKLLKQSQRGR